ncbi:MAG: hypothetical protein ETSY2_28985 [Candidatus Entotheonella gemina]|uniref:Haloacid dehalogenase n=1 Tax=Candidatus Entotheonella gemina TaxID=1429439 RepID=W4M250_9BACT|nr:MAG: hypothetical protein ETSY2_28985 [Candidatus Entotheonella gemina]
MPIKAILFDADGVIQQRPEGWKDALGERLGFRGNPSDFLAEVYDAETPILDGQTDFTEVLSNLLSRWNCRATLAEALDVWTMLDVASEITEMVRALKQSGVACHLASNQEPYKARYMSEVLGYRHLFDKEFYSCHIGLKKPDSGYFRAILSNLTLPPNQILFIDDRQANVVSARGVGLHADTFQLETGRVELLQILRAHGLYVTLND